MYHKISINFANFVASGVTVSIVVYILIHVNLFLSSTTAKHSIMDFTLFYFTFIAFDPSMSSQTNMHDPLYIDLVL